MTKTIMAVMTALVALSTPAFAAVTNDAAKAIYQDDNSAYPSDNEGDNPLAPSEDSGEND